LVEGENLKPGKLLKSLMADDTGNVKQKARQEGTYEARGAHIFKIAVELLKSAIC
jgi:hypothetical protein